ncbi:serine hydrolase domain-containing protein [Paraflavitalea pollutisoli]|uniref:serine hydrolase domain-containing protein n=1 Tax=Paraflavitalea pollutisoli TaxID=3034143 RepID=UPI0023EC20E5|nr:serine hydrolase domain-containing protein [Paraflavitalea sp. H1-2-19X]
MYILPRLLSILFLATLLTNAVAQPIRRIDGSSIDAAQLDEQVQKIMTQAKVTGLCVTVYNKNKAVFAKAYGYAKAATQQPMTPSTALYGLSLSKAVFAHLVMQLVDEKKIDLDKPLVTYLPRPLLSYTFPGRLSNYKDLEGDDRYKKITGRMCLDHTTGFPNFRWFEPDKKLRIKFEPGSRVSYSGEGLYLLQVIIQEITGKPLEELARQYIFEPCGMTLSSYVYQPVYERDYAVGHDVNNDSTMFPRRPVSNAAGSLTTTMEEFNKFYTMLINGKRLSKKSFNDMTHSQIRIRSIKQFGPLSWKDSTLNDNIQLGYGLGYVVLQSPYGRAFFKEGNDQGWGHYTICYPDQQIAVVILTNSDNGESSFKDLLQLTIGDVYTPWYWENYIPWNQR